MRELAILGPTASGKTSLGISLAKKLDGVVLSLDSLSIYKGIDIASAKPSLEERDGIKHFGIDLISPDEIFNVVLFFDLYKQARKWALANGKTLIIVGGTSFYLKSMLTGLSDKPFVSEQTKEKVARKLKDLNSSYAYMQSIDADYAKNISSNDTYRIEKWLEIHYETGLIPSSYLKQTQKEPIIKDIPIYNLQIDRDILRGRIEKRTDIMINSGLVDEVVGLEKKYGRLPRCMGAIGLKEVLEYLDGYLDLEQMREKIITNTARLAKRQRTFNKTQFVDFNILHASMEEVEERIILNS
ncbi:MAG: tRNA (adenosine(37)-N6)-dimethylallyltransferase MiaA [Proteobacteria bacterium]|nr:MAG: tRNA (adenosine(37)-N6)-dimethylallyltransferase MiaA [Pseudomonadota bacterium]